MTRPRLTPARRLALSKLHHSGPARYSNTSGPGSVYWQVAAWLLAEGYATSESGYVSLTEAGHELAGRLAS